MREKRKCVNEKSNLLLFVLEATKATAEEKQQNMGECCSDRKWHTLFFYPQIRGELGKGLKNSAFW